MHFGVHRLHANGETWGGGSELNVMSTKCLFLSVKRENIFAIASTSADVDMLRQMKVVKYVGASALDHLRVSFSCIDTAVVFMSSTVVVVLW